MWNNESNYERNRSLIMMDSSIISSTKLQVAAEEFYSRIAIIIFATQLAFLILKTIVHREEDAMKRKESCNVAISLPRSNAPPIDSRRVTWWPPTFRIVGKQEEKKIFLRAYRHRGALSVLLILIIIVVAVINDRRDRSVKSKEEENDIRYE